MIISKYSKSYDTADGSEQHFHDPIRRGQSGGNAARERWEDDGGPAEMQALVSVSIPELTSKPAWSVLSLRDVNEAIWQEHWLGSPIRLQREAERMERARLGAIQIEDETAAAVARAEKNHDRNPWENA
jgi:hypothetical protein